MTRLIIAGGGLAGCLAASALSKRRPDIDLTIVEGAETLGGNHTWSFFDTDVPPDRRWILEGIVSHHWPEHEVRFPKRQRIIPIGYNSIRSSDLSRTLRAALRTDQVRLNGPITELTATSVTLASGERLDADAVIDARGARPMPGITLGWQKFVGQVHRFSKPHSVTRPVIMDATVAQYDGYRFVYLLPLSKTDLLIEDTYYSANRTLDCALLESRIADVATTLGPSEVQSDESGILPVVIRGSFEDLWPDNDDVPRIGVAGGFFHPTTSYSLPDAVATAAFLAQQDAFSASALTQALRARAQHFWKERHYFQLLNRMLFGAAEPDERYRVLEHFYRLPDDLIARFYNAQLTRRDKLRTLVGKPPVSLTGALSALFRSAA